MVIANHLLLGIALGATQRTSLRAAPASAGSVNGQPQESRVVDGLTALGSMQGIDQSGPGASGIQALGEITERVISETLIHAQSPTRRRAHDLFHSVKAGFAQQATQDQSPQQNASGNLGLRSTVSGIGEVATQPQAPRHIAKQSTRGGGFHRRRLECCLRDKINNSALAVTAQRIFVDGVGLLGLAPYGGNSERGGFRSLLQQLIESLNRENLTAMLSLELGSVPDSIATVEMTDFLADTVIELGRERHGRRIQRSLEVLKSRGQDYDPGEHTLHITGGQGLEIFRRVQAPLRTKSKQPTSSTMRSVIGVQAVDTLIGGGVFYVYTPMVVGVSGVGKPVLGTQILREGSLKQKTRGLLISLDEHPAQIIRNAQTLGLNLEEQVADGTIRILFESPQELDIDSHYARIIRVVEEHDVQRMVIDGMTSYSTAIGEVGVYRDFFHAIVAYSKQRLMTTFFNYENPEFLGISSYMPDFPLSSIVDNLILLSLVEINNSLHRCISVVKSRGVNIHSILASL